MNVLKPSQFKGKPQKTQVDMEELKEIDKKFNKMHETYD